MTSAVLIVLGIAVVMLAACSTGGGGMSRDEYQRALQGIVHSGDAREADRLYLDLVVHEYPRAACATRARSLHGRLEAILERVERLDPPADARDAQEEFLRAGRESVDRIGELVDEVAGGDLACGMAYDRRAYGLPSTARAVRAIQQLERRGYVVFGE
jgi:hypothetical protein